MFQLPKSTQVNFQLPFSLPKDENATLLKELALYRYAYESFEGDDFKTKYYTGLRTFKILDSLHKAVGKYIVAHPNAKLTTFQMLLLTLMKLRKNFDFIELGYKFNVNRQTASNLFYKCLFVLYCKLKHFVDWPKRQQMWETMPKSFKEAFGSHLAVIIDCFEVLCEIPKDKTMSCQFFSHYKNHHTVKFLIGIAPQGVITFISGNNPNFNLKQILELPILGSLPVSILLRFIYIN